MNLNEYKTKRAEMLNEALNAVENKDLEKATSLKNEIETLDSLFDNLQTEFANQNALNDLEVVTIESQALSVEGEIKTMEKLNNEVVVNEMVNGFDQFVRTRGTVKNQVTSTDVGVLIPEEILYNPSLEIGVEYDLSKQVNRVKVSTAGGKHPIMKRPSTRLASTEELAANPALAKPEFHDVTYAIETYRGAIPVSSEAIEDSQEDLPALVARHAQIIKVNTLNYQIAQVLKTFTAKSATGIDGIKTIKNVNLKQAYKKEIVCTSSFYDSIDKAKDENGRYLLQDSIAAPSGKSLLGMPLTVVDDELLGTAGAKLAFVGDLQRGVAFFDRKDIAVRWVDHEINGEYLQAVVRFDVVKADADAGFFVTYTEPTPAV